MAITIEPLADDDVETLCRLACDIWRQHYPAIIGSAQTEYMLAQRYVPAIIRDELARGDIWWDVLRVNEEMIAFASSFPTEAGEVKLDKLYVHPARQREGYGGMLLAHTCERARQRGYVTLVLAVNRHNEKAIAAYRKHGFEIREAVVKDIGGGFVMDDFIMQKQVRREPGKA
jgi:ribosomal protein S18 acetylase RimI-like enzyme